MKTPAKPPPEPRPVPPHDRLEAYSPITTKSWLHFLGGAALFGALLFAVSRGTPWLDPTPPKPSTHGDRAAVTIEHATRRVRYIGSSDEDLGSCACSLEGKDSDGAERETCACTGRPTFVHEVKS